MGVRVGAMLVLMFAAQACSGGDDGVRDRTGGGDGGAGQGDGSGAMAATGGLVGGQGGTGGHAATGGDGAAGGGGACAWADARPVVREPAIWLVLDQLLLLYEYDDAQGVSAGHNKDLLRSLLFGPGGVVTRLQHLVHFGFATHSATGLDPECPVGQFVPAALDNEANIRAAFEALELTGTAGPASYVSIDLIAEEIAAQDPPLQNALVLLKHTFEGAACGDLLGAVDVNRLVHDAVQRVTTAGVGVSVVSVPQTEKTAGATAPMVNREAKARHDALAALGGGQAVLSSDVDAFTAAIERFVEASVGCNVALDGEVKPGGDCDGEVALGDRLLECDAADGYRLLDRSTIELTGAACDQLKADPSLTVSARFPCEVFVNPQ